MKAHIMASEQSYLLEQSIEQISKRLEKEGHKIIDIKFQYQWISYGHSKYAAMIIYE